MKTGYYKSRIVWVGLLILVSLSATSTECLAVWGWHDTWCAWQRTWHAPSAFDTPLNPYFVPRTSEFYDVRGYVGGCGVGIAEEGWHCRSVAGEELEVPYRYPTGEVRPSAAVEFERLGRIPNDLSPGLGNPTGPPRRVGR